MAQRYAPGIAHERMSNGLCPECGNTPGEHSSDARFWMPRACDLTVVGVIDRLAQHQEDVRSSPGERP